MEFFLGNGEKKFFSPMLFLIHIYVFQIVQYVSININH